MASTDTGHHEGPDAPALDESASADVATPQHGPKEHDHPKDSLYVVIALVLAVLTALEVSTYYLDFGALFLPTLLVLMSVKFWLVVQFFMHLKFDAKIFGRLFWTGLFLALGVYVAALATFQVFLS
jgi:cytochrome c oxidase subunit 4